MLRLCSVIVHLSETLSLFCLLRLISASADRLDYIANFSGMIELLLELKNRSF